MQKKSLIILAVVALVGCLCAVGCANGGPAGGTAAPKADVVAYETLEDFEAAHTSTANYEFAKMANFPCTSCHGMDAEALFSAYQADPASISVTRDKCITCHSEAAWPEELEATYDNVKDWNTYVGVGTAEHQAWVDGALQYTTGRPPMGDYEQECALCHTMHASAPTMYCTQCHNTDQGTGDCMTCHERILGEGMEFEGQDAETVTATLMERMQANGGHISSVMTAPSGWTECPSLLK